MPPKEAKQKGTAGDGGAREEEVLASTAALDAKAEEEFLSGEGGQIVADTTARLLDLFKHRPKPWSELSQTEQRDLAAALESNAKEIVRQIAEAVARDGREPIRAILESYAEKDGIRVTLKVKPFDEDEALAAVVGLHKAQGKNVLITVASADDYHEAPARDESEPDQPALGFEAGSDEHPADDSDLADAAVIIRTGDQLDEGRARVNLTTGMIEALPEDGDEGSYIDIREATPAELAAERERTADFVEETA